ncbi:MAG: c-type cytochrome [Hyphomicrobiales bacterium]
MCGTSFANSQDAAEIGKIAYGTYCAVCHGTGGKGDGPVAGQLRRKPADLTLLAKAVGGTFPKESVRAIVDGREMFAAHGSREMPLWGEMFTFESTGGGVADDGMDEITRELVNTRIDQLVAYIGTLQE